jgi:fibronectin-binding autotransporter adhesin
MRTKSVQKLFALVGLLLAGDALEASAASLIWSGTSNPATNWDVGVTPNWKNGPASSYFNNGDTVTFNDSGITTTINLATNVQPASVTVDSTHNYTLSGTNSIVGTAAFLKNGSGTLTLSSSNAFSGGLTISNGTVTVGNAYGAGSGIINLAGGSQGLAAVGADQQPGVRHQPQHQ